MNLVFGWFLLWAVAQEPLPTLEPGPQRWPTQPAVIDCSDKPALQEVLRELAAYPLAPTAESQANWDRCKPKLSPKEKKCFEQLEKHIASFPGEDLKTHGLQIADSNEKHWARIRAIDPDATKPPPGLEKGIDEAWVKDYEDCRKRKSETGECARFKGFQVAAFRSLDCRANGARVAVVLYKGDKIDKWLLFNPLVSDKLEFKKGNYFQQITIQKKDASGRRLSDPIPFFMAYTKHDQKLTATGCLNCHSSGLIGINPIPGSFAAGDSALVGEMNRYRSGYGGFDIDTHVRLDDRLPRLGKSNCIACHGSKTIRDFNPIYSDKAARARVLLGMDMPPRHSRHLVHEFFRAIEKTDQLSEDQKKQVAAEYLKNGETTVCNEDDVLNARKKNLEILKGKLLTPEEYEKALKGLEQADKESRSLFKEFSREARLAEQNFLVGGNPNCILEANGIRPAVQPAADGRK